MLQVNTLVELYNSAKYELTREGINKISLIIPEISPHAVYVGQANCLSALMRIIIGCITGINAIMELLKKRSIPEELENKLRGFREELEKMKDIEPDVYKNLELSISEIEHGHYIASTLISARVVDCIIGKFNGTTIEEKIGDLVNSGLIDKDRKDEIRNLTFAAKKQEILFPIISRSILPPTIPWFYWEMRLSSLEYMKELLKQINKFLK